MSATQGPGKTIVLHIGLHKTGTSSIQATLKHNQEMFCERGVPYPGSLPYNPSHFFINAVSGRAKQYHINRRQGLDTAAIAERASGWMGLALTHPVEPSQHLDIKDTTE